VAGRLAQAVTGLYPGYFALVMATGIISIAAHLLGMPAWLPWSLFVFNILAYAVLWLLTGARLVWHLPRVMADLTDHARGPGFLTAVAATCVLGVQCVLLAGATGVALGLWGFGLLLWGVLLYTFLAAVTVRAPKPSLEEGLNGAWLLLVVSTQSVALLGVRLAPGLGAWGERVFFLALALWLVGCMFYLLIIGLIFYRFTFFSFTPAMLSPPYWINMGAIAITTMVGATLALSAPAGGWLAELLPFIKGLTLLFWSFATWWIPLLLILGVWRHGLRRFPLAYDPQYWGLVFPLGMYTACTVQLARALELPFLLGLPRVFIYLALLAWALTFIGLARRVGAALVEGLKRPAAVR
jgi:tellurite resistance protein TehA-like permease